MSIDISICMPYFNRMEALEKTLISYESCGYFAGEKKVEVIICDDGSKKEPAYNMKSRPWVWLIVLPEKDDWKCACLPINVAVSEARGKYVLLTSPEIYHPKPVLFHMFEYMENPHDVVLACVKAEEKDVRMKPWGMWYSHPIHRPVKYWWCQMMETDFFREIHGFDERYRAGRGWEDDDFSERLTKAGATWKWAESCVVYHPSIGKKPIVPKNPNPALFQKTHHKRNAR